MYHGTMELVCGLLACVVHRVVVGHRYSPRKWGMLCGSG